MTSKLEKTIAQLYETFEKYQSNLSMEGSPLYGDLREWNQELFSKSLRDLSDEDLSRFTGKAITTWGNELDYKHFLPRIFELIAELRCPYEIWIAFEKLSLAEWNNWKEDEQKLVQEYMIALWESMLHDESEKAEYEFQNYFASIAHFYPKFDDLLILWEVTESKASIKHLSNFIVNEEIALFERNKIRGFYDRTEHSKELINWILSEKTVKMIQRKYFEFENESFSEKISWAEQIVTFRIKSNTCNNL